MLNRYPDSSSEAPLEFRNCYKEMANDDKELTNDHNNPCGDVRRSALVSLLKTQKLLNNRETQNALALEIAPNLERIWNAAFRCSTRILDSFFMIVDAAERTVRSGSFRVAPDTGVSEIDALLPPPEVVRSATSSSLGSNESVFTPN